MKRTIMAAAMILMAIAFISGCTDKIKSGSKEVTREKISGVEAQRILPTQVDDLYETSGTVRAKTVSVVASRVMGAVTSIKVKEGDMLKKGQVLLTIDDSDIKQKLMAAEEGYREAEKALEVAEQNRDLIDATYRRYRKLRDEKALSGQEMDEIETQKKIAELNVDRSKAAVGRAEAGMKEAEVYHAFTRVTSPVDGVVTGKHVETGSMAAPGMPLMTVEDTSSFRLDIYADEKLSSHIRTGRSVSVNVNSLNQELTGTIAEVVPSVDPVSRTFLVKISLKGEGLQTGQYGRVSFPVGTKEVLLVPQHSLIERGQLTGVYVVGRDSVVTYRLIRTGKMYDQNVEVLSGLNPGDQVIVDGVEKAVDGGIIVENVPSASVRPE